MADSQFRLIGRGLGVLAAASLLAGVSMDAAAFGGKGVIKLVTDNSTGFAWFEFFDAAGNKTETQDFSIVRASKCVVDEDQWVNWKQGVGSSVGLPALVELKAIRNPFLSADDTGVGLLNASLGVYDNSKGTSCSRMTDALGEGLTLTSKKGAFDRLELDIEAKGSAVFELQIDKDPNKVYRLFTGLNATHDDASLPKATSCSNGSDSGPDSNLNDNCPWVINDVGVSFSIKPIPGYGRNGVNGEGSLEGGGDYATAFAPGDNSTKIYLTSLVDVGNLGCASTNNKTAEVYSSNLATPAAACQVTRINTNGILGGTCTELIPYRLETFTADNLCKLDKTADVKDPLAASLRVTFKKEPRTDWDVSQTEVTFTGQLNGTKLLANRCAGSVVNDPYGHRTIAQVADTSCVPGSSAACSGSALTTKLKGSVVGDDFVAGDTGSVFLSDANDEVPDNGYIDWACVLDHTVIYVGDGSPSSPVNDDEDQQVVQTMLFWGDINWSRL